MFARQVKSNPDYEVTVQDVAAWEDTHGLIPAGAVVMAYTGWDERWNSHQEFRNQRSGELTHYPGFSLEAANSW
jgi:kynurenine formamidase